MELFDSNNKDFKMFVERMEDKSDEEIKMYVQIDIEKMDRSGWLMVMFFIWMNFGLVRKE